MEHVFFPFTDVLIVFISLWCGNTSKYGCIHTEKYALILQYGALHTAIWVTMAVI